MGDKTKDLAGPGIGDYGRLIQDLPDNYQALLNDRIPQSIGGGVGQARTFMYLLRTAHLGEVTVSVWPKELKDICMKKNIHLLE